MAPGAGAKQTFILIVVLGQEQRQNASSGGYLRSSLSLMLRTNAEMPNESSAFGMECNGVDFCYGVGDWAKSQEHMVDVYKCNAIKAMYLTDYD